MNRRRFLQGSLTLAGLGALGCGSARPPSPSLSGERKDPSWEAGHRWRDGSLPAGPVRQEQTSVVILGGGVAGLSAGWRLRHAGLEELLLLELEPDLGGNSRALPYPVTPAPIGAHYLPLPNLEARAVRRLLQEMNVLRPTADGGWSIDPLHLCRTPEERLFYRGEWYLGLLPEELLDPETVEQVLRFQEHISQWQERRDAEGRKVFALPISLSSRDPSYTALDRMSFAEYVKAQGWTSPHLLWYLEYGCRDDFGGSLQNCSAWAGLHYFAARDGGGLGDSGDILVWPEGNQRLVAHLSRSLPVGSRTRSLVLKVVPESDGVTVDYLDLARNERVRVKAEVAVSCLPTFLRPYYLPDESPWGDFVYPPWLTANLCLKRPPDDLQGPGFIAWDNVLYDSDSLGYVVATHQQMAFDPLRPTVWTWYRPFPDGDVAQHREALLKADWAAWADTVVRDLLPAHPNLREVLERLDVTVLGHGMIRPSPGLLWGTAIDRARQPKGRLLFGHGDLSGMSIFEESQYRGVHAAEQALSLLGQPFESFL